MAKSKVSFEESMDRLEQIVQDLENNEQPLDQTIQLFEEGLQLVKSCDEKLKQFETQVDELIKNNGSGSNEN